MEGSRTTNPSDVLGAAKDAARATLDAVSGQASALAGSVADEVAQTGEQQKQRGADALCAFACAVRKAADDIHQESPMVARQIQRAAEKVETFSESLRGRNVKDLLADATELARSQPAAFFAGSMVAGFALARFLKSSAPARSSAASDALPAAPMGEDGYGSGTSGPMMRPDVA